MSDDFKYDVAFSFLSGHESLALQLRDELSDHLATFVYSREQPELVGRHMDGVDGFTAVFRNESRVCVILLSENWGSKGYTHIEAAAMRERTVESGWDFLVVACLDDTAPPKWIPTTKIWYGFKRYGLKGLVAAIDLRVTELGGRPGTDSVLDKAARAQRQLDFAKAKQHFSTSAEGFDRANTEFDRLRALVRTRVGEVSPALPSAMLESVANEAPYRGVAMVSERRSAVFYWQPQYSNSLESAALLVIEYGGRFSYHGFAGGPPRLEQWSITPTIDYADRVVWQFGEHDDPITSEALVDHFLERMVDPPSRDRSPRSPGSVSFSTLNI